jgi:hypothetical protein
MKNNYDKRHLPFGHSTAIQDKETLSFIDNCSISTQTLNNQTINDEDIFYIKSK